MNDLKSVMADYFQSKKKDDQSSDSGMPPSKMAYDACLKKAAHYRKEMLEIEEDDTLEDDLKE